MRERSGGATYSRLAGLFIMCVCLAARLRRPDKGRQGGPPPAGRRRSCLHGHERSRSKPCALRWCPMPGSALPGGTPGGTTIQLFLPAGRGAPRAARPSAPAAEAYPGALVLAAVRGRESSGVARLTIKYINFRHTFACAVQSRQYAHREAWWAAAVPRAVGGGRQGGRDESPKTWTTALLCFGKPQP